MSDNPSSKMEKLEVLRKIQSMKVGDLKKKLKARCLPITGNKTDLVKRLTEAYISENGSETFAAELKDPAPELDAESKANIIEENSLLHNGQFSSSLAVDSNKALSNSQEESKSSLNAPIAKPLKKRVVASASTSEDEGKVVQKKIKLNRNNTTLNFDFLNHNPRPSVKCTSDLGGKAADDNKKITAKGMPDTVRQAVRADRHNPIVFSVSEKSSGSSKLNTSTNTSNISMSDLDRLKKRAARFGESVSSYLKEMEEKEKLMKRKFKFGTSVPLSATSSLDDEEKKRRRAERFGLS